MLAKTTSLFASLFLLISPLLLTAQYPVLDSANFVPMVGEMFSGYALDSATLANFNPGQPGPNRLWDHSNVTVSQADTVSIISVDSTPATADYSGSHHCQFHSIDNSYHFYEADAMTMSFSGVLFSGGLEIPHSDPIDYLRFPMTFTDAYIDSLQATADFQGQTYIRNGHAMVVVDGYGTLLLPGMSAPWGTDTVENVLRVHYYESLFDSSSNGDTYDHQREIIVWLKPGFHYPLLSYSTSTTNGITNGPVGSVFPQEGYIVSIPELVAPRSVVLYPNPTAAMARLEFDLSRPELVEVRLINGIGQVVTMKDCGRLPSGRGQVELETSGLARGMYWVEIVAGKSRVVKPLSLQ